MTTDTSTQAVEAMAERILRAAGNSLGNYTLYRQSILDQVRYAMDYGNVVERASARRTALEDAAKVAGPLPLADNSDYEKQAYDLRCVIASAIRALIETTNEEK